MINQVLIGVGAGLTAALLYASAATLSPLALMLFYLGPLPIFLSALGWGMAAGLAAGVTAGLVLGVVQAPGAAALFLFSVVVPALILAHLARLGRKNQGGGAEHYPVGRLLLWASGISAVTTVTTTLVLGIGVEEIKVVVSQLIQQLVEAQPELAENQDALNAMAETIARIIVPLSSVSWAVALILNLWLSGRILKLSDRLPRPWPNLHHVTVPPRLHFALAIAVALSFVGGQVGFVAVVAASCLALVFVFVGLSVIHHLTNGQPTRPLILSIVYAIIIFLTVPLSFLPLMIVAGIGLAEPHLALRARAAQARGEPPPPTAA
ncbi:hypothetical protein MNBD_ALPHA09-970 [hydrothermal vent metagenome]|uniref:DUF2232 domain-containing protein n=1 Tax=hydrothermal vent metagenome TaxID=652676 RepID=A0A3B0TQL7_9ZZZZ